MNAAKHDLDTMRHSAAHLMAAAVRHLWPDAKFDIGPSTSDGFYYDFDLEHRLSAEDFPAIEAEMAKIVAENVPFVREAKHLKFVSGGTKPKFDVNEKELASTCAGTITPLKGFITSSTLSKEISVADIKRVETVPLTSSFSSQIN